MVRGGRGGWVIGGEGGGSRGVGEGESHTLIIVAVPLPDGPSLVHNPERPVPEARLPDHRQVRQLMVADEPPPQ